MSPVLQGRHIRNVDAGYRAVGCTCNRLVCIDRDRVQGVHHLRRLKMARKGPQQEGGLDLWRVLLRREPGRQ